MDGPVFEPGDLIEVRLPGEPPRFLIVGAGVEEGEDGGSIPLIADPTDEEPR